MPLEEVTAPTPNDTERAFVPVSPCLSASGYALNREHGTGKRHPNR